MNRRGFLGTATAAAIAGPKAIEEVLHRAQIEWQLRHQAMTAMRAQCNMPMSAAYRKMQQALLDGFCLEPHEWDVFEKEPPGYMFGIDKRALERLKL